MDLGQTSPTGRTSVLAADRRRGRVAWLVSALLVLLATGWTTPTQHARAAGGTARLGPVVVIGDSLTYVRAGELETALEAAGFGPAWIDALPGRRLLEQKVVLGYPVSSGLDAIAAAHASGVRPAVWVVALGTNDIDIVRSPREQREMIRTILRAIGPGETVVWVDVWAPSSAAASQVFDRSLESVAATRPTMSVSRWSTQAQAHPTWFTWDGIHNTIDGQRTRNSHLVEAAVSATAAWPSTTPTPVPQPLAAPSGATGSAPALVGEGQDRWVPAGRERHVDFTGRLDDDESGVVIDLRARSQQTGTVEVWRCGDGADRRIRLPVTRRGLSAQVVLAIATGDEVCITPTVGARISWRIVTHLAPRRGQRLEPLDDPVGLLGTTRDPVVLAAATSTPLLARHTGSAVVGLTITGRAIGGAATVTVQRCGAGVSPGVGVSLGTGRTTTEVLVPRGGRGPLCVRSTRAAELSVTLSVVSARAGAWIQPVAPITVLDTAEGTGGWTGRLRLGQRLRPDAVQGSVGAIGWMTTGRPSTRVIVGGCDGTPSVISAAATLHWWGTPCVSVRSRDTVAVGISALLV